MGRGDVEYAVDRRPSLYAASLRVDVWADGPSVAVGRKGEAPA